MKDFTTTIHLSQSAEEVFKAVANPRGWWSEEITGGTSQLNDVFNYHFEDLHRCRIKLIEVIPNQVMVWHVLENHFKFNEADTEWKDTKIIFEISKAGDKTQLKMTHAGLVPGMECFEICRGAWTTYIQKSLKALIETGKGTPNAKGKPQTEDEKKMLEN